MREIPFSHRFIISSAIFFRIPLSGQAVPGRWDEVPHCCAESYGKSRGRACGDGRWTSNDGRFRLHSSVARFLPAFFPFGFSGQSFTKFSAFGRECLFMPCGERPVKVRGRDSSFTLFLLYPRAFSVLQSSTAMTQQPFSQEPFLVSGLHGDQILGARSNQQDSFPFWPGRMPWFFCWRTAWAATAAGNWPAVPP